MTRPIGVRYPYRAGLWLALVVAGLGIGPLFAGPAAAPASGGPLRFAHRTLDFGEVLVGDPVRFDLPFRNVSTQPVTLLGVRSTCGCVVGRPSETTIAPGAAGALDIAFATAGRFGPQSATVHVHTDASPGSPTRLVVEGMIRAPLLVHPRGVIYDNVSPGPTYPARIHVRVREPVRDVRVAVEGAFLSAVLEGTTTSPQHIDVAIHTQPDTTELVGAVALSCVHARSGRNLSIRIPIRVSIPRALRRVAAGAAPAEDGK